MFRQSSIYTRVDAYFTGYTEDFEVVVSNISSPVTDILTSPGFKRCGQHPGVPVPGEIVKVTCSPGPIRGRYVYISNPDATFPLVLCEVRVYGGAWHVV